ncbi:aminoglycoside phosphotransferase family protein [Streptomyces fimicarius]|uniref:aminoglycoside phosphotransferase family protein n=1 Tax=Streptomyces griseus TaxID=1911 RepID=UPI0036C513A3
MIDIPEELAETQSRFNGAAGRAFVAGLPDLAARCLERWGLRPLSGETDVREAVKVLGSVLARLVAVPAPEGLRTLGGVAERMLAEAPERVGLLADAADRRLLADCAAAVREVAGEPGDRLLHWDLHYDNVLAGRADAGRAGEWVALDPKPLAGDPGFELFPALDNLFDADEVVWRFDALTEALGLERERARAWTLGRVLQNGLWGAEKGEGRLAPDHAEIARRLLGR